MSYFKVHSILRKTYDRGPTDEMEDLNVNAAIWGMFMDTTLQAAVHRGQDYDHNLRFVKNNCWSSSKKLSKETEKMIKNQAEIIGVSMIDYGDYAWSATSLPCDTINSSDLECHFLRLRQLGALSGRYKREPERGLEGENHLTYLNRIDGESMEFEWNNIPRTHNIWPPRTDSRIYEGTTV